jgi:hypothetical protein
MSNRVMTTLEEMSPRVEIYSIDEAFCDLTGVRNCRVLEEFGREIRATVLQRTHLTVGVGIAPTKTLAKLANHAAKKWQKQTGGVVDLSNIDRQRRLMALVPVEDVWGVGRRISKKLNAMGVKTALDLSEQSTWVIRNILTWCWSEPSGSYAESPASNWRSLPRPNRKSFVHVLSAVVSPTMTKCARQYAATRRAHQKNFVVNISIAGLFLRS